MSNPIPPTCKTTNWAEYNAAPKRCDSLTIWFDPQTAWEMTPSGKRGRQQAPSGYQFMEKIKARDAKMVQARERDDHTRGMDQSENCSGPESTRGVSACRSMCLEFQTRELSKSSRHGTDRPSRHIGLAR